MTENESTIPPNDERWCSFRWFAFSLAVLLGLRFNGIFTGLESFTLRDFSMFGYPLAAQLQRSLFAGELPLWDSLTQCGTPFLAQWNTMALYPPMLLAALLPLTWSLSVFCVAHQFVGGLGAWRLAYRFTNDRAAAALAGFAYAGHGLVQSSLMWPNNIAALGLLPWVLLFVEAACRERGRRWFAAVLIGALQMLTGGPEVILLTWVTATGLVAVQAWHQAGFNREAGRRMLALAGLVAMVSLLAAAQLLPFAELLQHSHREAGFGGDQWSASAMAWANLLTPLFATIEAPGRVFYHQAQGWTHSYYAGMTVLALAVAAPFLQRDRRLWIAAAGALVFLLVAMGDAGRIYPLIANLPPFSFLRFPVKFLIPLTILLPVLGAIGFARVRRMRDAGGRPCDPRRLRLLLALITLAWLVAFVAGFGNDRIQQADHVGNSVARGLVFALCASALIALVRGTATRWLPPLIVGVAALDLQVHQPQLAPTIPAHQYTAKIPALETLRKDLAVGPSRAALTAYVVRNLNANSLANKEDLLLLDRLALFGDCNLIDGLPKVNGFYSLYLKNYREVQATFHATDHDPSKPIADFLGVSHVMRHTNMFHWMPRAGAMPLITGGQEPVFVKPDESLPHLSAIGFRPRIQVLLPAENQPDIVAGRADVVISQVAMSPHHVHFHAEANTNALVVIAQPHYPGWRARVNGAPARILRANHAFQAVAIGPGSSEVVLEFHSRPFQIGLLISAAGFCFCIGGLACWRKDMKDRPR